MLWFHFDGDELQAVVLSREEIWILHLAGQCITSYFVRVPGFTAFQA